MLRTLVLTTLVGSLMASPIASAQPDTDPQVAKQLQEYKAAMKEFGGTLKGELKKAMKSGGPMAAVSVCHTEAPKIAQRISQQTGFDIHRTSLKPRATAPLAWEKPVLEGFEEQKAAGKPLKTMQWHQVVEVDGERTLRFMKPIKTEAICLTCHGTKVDPALMTKIKSLYPQDHATGFKLGDIRGAFSISAPLKD
jgi:hypothetical protein